MVGQSSVQASRSSFGTMVSNKWSVRGSMAGLNASVSADSVQANFTIETRSEINQAWVPARFVLKHFVRAGDTRQEVRRTALMLNIVIIVSFLFGLLLIFSHGSSAGTASADASGMDVAGHPKEQILTAALVDAEMLVCGFLVLVDLWFHGLTTRLKLLYCGNCFIMNIVSAVIWASFPAHIPLSCVMSFTLMLETPADKLQMRCLCNSMLIMFLVCSCVDVYDRTAEKPLGIHPWHGEEPFSWPGWFLCITLPIVLNTLFLQSYTSRLRLEEDRLNATINLGYKVSELLANFDLNAAEALLQSEGSHDLGKPLAKLLANLRSYRPFLPDSLFAHEAKSRRSSITKREYLSVNEPLATAMYGKTTSWEVIQKVVRRLPESDYTLSEFHKDIRSSFPELELFTLPNSELSSGWSGLEELDRTLGAFYSLYCLLRLNLDGKEVLSFGVDFNGVPCMFPDANDAARAAKQQSFYESMQWNTLAELISRAGFLGEDPSGKVVLQTERVVAMLAMTAMHDIMKNTCLLPTVLAKHAPYRGYNSGDRIADHDVALSYILEYFSGLLPSYENLAPGQRAPVIFSHSKMGFNNGWFVQGEAPPGALFSQLLQTIRQGGASQADIGFYFVHWFTDLAGAEPFGCWPWRGAEKFTLKFPLKVLGAFLHSFAFIDQLVDHSEVQVMENYLQSRWSEFGFQSSTIPAGCEVALMRLSLMAQGFERELVLAFLDLPDPVRKLLAREMSMTGRVEQYSSAPNDVISSSAGPAILVYYGPALIQKAKAQYCYEALVLLSEVFRSTRSLFPLETSRITDSVTVRIDVLKSLTPEQIAEGGPWHVRRTSQIDAEVAFGETPPGAVPFEYGDSAAQIDCERLEEVITDIIQKPHLPPLQIWKDLRNSGEN